MYKLWPQNQPQENQCECPRCQPCPWNQNQRPHSRGSRRIHLPRFHHLHELGPWLRISRRIGKHTGRHVQIDQQSLGKHIADWKYQKAHLPGMRSRYLALQQWNLDHLHETGTPLELFPSTMPHYNTNSEKLSRAGTPSMYSPLIQHHLRIARRKIAWSQVTCENVVVAGSKLSHLRSFIILRSIK